MCADLIAEVADLFDSPRLFHLGMDEETASDQRRLLHTVTRQGDLWWHDLEFLLTETEKTGARPWVWSDPAWQHPDTYFDRMPASVLQSNWYYEMDFTSADATGRPRKLGPGQYHLTYLDLDEHGFEQVPTGSTWTDVGNFERTVQFCRGRLDPSRVLGFLQTPWKMTERQHRDMHLQAIDAGRRAKQIWEAAT